MLDAEAALEAMACVMAAMDPTVRQKPKPNKGAATKAYMHGLFYALQFMTPFESMDPWRAPCAVLAGPNAHRVWATESVEAAGFY
eukprot:8113529-Heterocapsa_arctica.AAC.1